MCFRPHFTWCIHTCTYHEWSQHVLNDTPWTQHCITALKVTWTHSCLIQLCGIQHIVPVKKHNHNSIHSMLLSDCSTLQSVQHTSALCARWRGVGEWAQHERNVMLGRLLQVKHNLQSIEAHSSFLSLEFLLKQFMMATHNMWEHTCRKVGFMETALKLYFTEYSSNTRSMEHNNL